MVMNKDRTYLTAVVKDNVDVGTALLRAAHPSKPWTFQP
jgi:hypothetical protein